MLDDIFDCVTALNRSAIGQNNLDLTPHLVVSSQREWNLVKMVVLDHVLDPNVDPKQ